MSSTTYRKCLIIGYLVAAFFVIPSCSKPLSPNDDDTILISSSREAELSVNQLVKRLEINTGLTIPTEYLSLIPQKILCFDKILYHSNGDECSALVVYPLNEAPKGLMLGMHYTIAKADEAPTESLIALEAICAYLGMYVVIPDYVGFGETSDRVHPYLHVESIAQDAECAVLACREYLEDEMNIIIGDSLYVSGYSEGGANALAFQKVAEREMPTAMKLQKVYCGGAPCDLVATMNLAIESNYNAYPYGVAMVPLGLDAGSELNIDFSKIFSGKLASQYREWILSKGYTSQQVNDFIGSTTISDFMHPDFFNGAGNSEIAKLNKALKENSLVDGWIPKAPIHMMHGADDKIVPLVNALNAYNSFKAKGSNIVLDIRKGQGHEYTCFSYILHLYTDLSIKLQGK